MRLQVAYTLLSTYLSNLNFGLGPLTTLFPSPSLISNDIVTNKSIAIVGAGSGGLAMLKALTELPEETKQSLDFILLEEREDVGGVWLPNNHVSYPPEIPETPLYPRLRTNSPVPSMTYPNFTFPPGTPLFPHHSHILSYHQRFSSHYNLYPHIAFNHKVLEANWVGTSAMGKWNLTILTPKGVNETRMVDHLVVASGNNHVPNIPSWPGQNTWLKQASNREIVHSVYYRYPDRYTNRTVLVVGGGFSGKDACEQISEVAEKVYVSLRSAPGLGVQLPPSVEVKPGILHFTNNTIVFDDESEIEVDTVLLATGYEIRKSFLEAGNTMTVVDEHQEMKNNASLELEPLKTNRKYIYPLYRHIFSLCPLYPPTALSFVGITGGIIPHCPLDYAQSLFIIHLILNPTILPTRREMLLHLAAEEQNLRDNGLDPYAVGHKLLRLLDGPNDYQEELIDFLKEKSAIPSSAPKYIEKWRRDAGTYFYLYRGWKRIVNLGREDEWLQGIETEDQWADLMRRVDAWQKGWEDENNIPFVHDFPGADADEDYW